MPTCAHPQCPNGTVTKPLRCGGCASVYYCDAKCQASHWKVHKHRCKELRQMRDWRPTGAAKPPSDGRCLLLSLPSELIEGVCFFMCASTLLRFTNHVRRRPVTGDSVSLTLQDLNSTDALWCALVQVRLPLYYAHCTRGKKKGVSDVVPIGTQTWKAYYRAVVTGKVYCTLQVFNKENNSEFFVSCYNGNARMLKLAKDPKLDQFRVKYLEDGRGDIWETVHRTRTRCVPRDVQTTPYEVCLSRDPVLHAILSAPTEPLSCVFAKGTHVEIQWKKQMEHPFGWWYGTVDAVDEKARTIRVVFAQYYEQSPWYSVTVTAGTLKPTTGMTGFLGGIRVVEPHYVATWQKCLPKNKIY